MQDPAPQPPAPSQDRRGAGQGQRCRHGLNGTDRAQTIVGAGLAEHIQQDRTAVDRIDQLVDPIGIADLIDEGTLGIGIGARGQGVVGGDATTDILQGERDTTGEQAGVAEQALQICRALVRRGLQPDNRWL